LFVFLLLVEGLYAQKGAADLIRRADEAYKLYDYDRAQSYYYEGLFAAEKNKQYREVALAQLGLAKSYYYQHARNESFSWFSAHLKTVEQHGYEDLEPMANYCMGAMYVESSNADSAVYYCDRAILLFEKIEDWLGVSKTHAILAELFINQMPTDEAKLYYHLRQSEKFALKSGNPEALAFTMMKYFNFYFRNKRNYERALYYINQTESLCKIIQNPEVIYNTYRSKAECLIFLKDTAAYQYLHQWFRFKDSVLNEQKIQNVAKYETLFEVQKLELAMELQNSKLMAEKKTKTMYLMILILVLIVVLLAYFMNRIRVKQQMQLILAQKNEAMVKEIYKAEQKERIRLARDLHDSIGQKLSVMKMLLPNDEHLDLGKIHQYLDETANEVRSISHNLIPEILNLGFLKALKNLADYYNASKKINFKLDIKENAVFRSISKEVEVALYRILQELLTNITKHAQAGEIEMTVSFDNNEIVIIVNENGRGLDKDKIKQSKGLGWRNIFARIQLLNGSIDVESKSGLGSTFIIKIPVYEAQNNFG
jgi:signal transduction histidine kinase